MMKSRLLLALFVISLTGNALGQFVGNYIFQVRLDSIEKNVRELSGEDSVFVNGERVIIHNRGNSYDNDLAADYIKQRLESFNLNVFEHVYSSTGRNIVATQQGAGNGDSTLIICAHYDAVTDYCADDNASGVAAVLEAARILAPNEFEHTIKYVLFDEEENGLIGSENYVSYISPFPQNIISVINVEMLGWETDNPNTGYDGKFDLISNQNPLSLKMKDSFLDIVSTYNLNLDPISLYGIGGSDHESFWDADYPAICYSEAFHSGDPNPYYHSSLDRIDKFHMLYFLELVKLGVGSLAKSAIPYSTTNLDTQAEAEFSMYPNPCKSQIINIQSPKAKGFIDICSLKANPSLLKRIPFDGSTTIDAKKLGVGIYVVRLISGNQISSKKLIVL